MKYNPTKALSILFAAIAFVFDQAIKLEKDEQYADSSITDVKKAWNAGFKKDKTDEAIVAKQKERKLKALPPGLSVYVPKPTTDQKAKIAAYEDALIKAYSDLSDTTTQATFLSLFPTAPYAPTRDGGLIVKELIDVGGYKPIVEEEEEKEA